MKFVCDRCQTKYSIPDDKVRGRILKVRCKSCSNVVTVKEPGASGVSAAAEMAAERTVISDRPMPPPDMAAPLRPARPTLSSAAVRSGDSGRSAAVGAGGAAVARAAAPALRTHSPVPEAAGDDILWFMAVAGVQKGPFPRKVLVDKLTALPKDADVHIWNEGLDGWKPPRQVPAIASELRQRQVAAAPPPPPPPPASRPRALTGAPGQTAAPRLSASSMAVPVGSAALSNSAAHALSMTAPGAVAAMTSSSPSVHAPPHHKDKGQNGVDGHAGAALAVAGASPAALLPNGESSDVMNVLNLNVPRAQGAAGALPGATPPPEAAGVSSGWQVPVVTSTTTNVPPAAGRTRGSVKLVAAFVGVVAVCIFGLYNFVLVKKPASPEAPLADKAKVAAAVAEAAPAPKEAPAAAKIGEKAPAKEEGASAPTAGRVPPAAKPGTGPKKGPRVTAGRPSAPALEPAPFAPSPTSDQEAAAARFADTSRRVVQVKAGGSGTSAGRLMPDQGEITRVVKNNKGGINICYQRALLRDNSLTHGKVDIEISIGTSGRVKKVTIDGPASFRVLDPCIRDVINRWAFPQSSEEYSTQFSSSFVGSE
jgi:predicted Zn finger-like uncharacterized protein